MNGIGKQFRIWVGSGTFEARYLAFFETISTLRRNLHRCCARLTGSAMDGEGILQECAGVPR
jgi:RNA polymerase sigma-70 factor, ECF subfamily